MEITQTLDDGSSMCDLLSHRYRRHVLDRLTEGDRSHSLDELAATIANRERATPSADGTRTRIDDVRVALYHNHLPRLADHGLIAFERDNKIARLDRPSGAVDGLLAST